MDYEFINTDIIDGSVMNMYLVISKVKYGDIDSDGTKFQGYYIIRLSSSPYTLQEDLNIDERLFLLVKCYVRELIFSL